MIAIIRAAMIAAVILSIGLAGSASAASPEPDTLGASVQSVVYVRDSNVLTVQNRSTVEALVTFSPAEGWAVEPATITLRPGERGHVAVTGDAPDGAAIHVVLTSAGDIPAGMTRTALAFDTTVMHDRPVDPTGWLPGALWAAVGLTGAVLLVLRLRPWRLRLTRAAT